MDAYIINYTQRREQEVQPRLELPLPPPVNMGTPREEESAPRGVIVIQII